MPATSPPRGRDRARAAARAAFGLQLLPDRFPALHGLRLLAILGVLQHHTTQIMLNAGFALPRGFAALSIDAFFGMDLFFVMSGFLIGTILLEADAAGPRATLRFYARRVFRTFPPYYVVLTGLVLATPDGSAKLARVPYEYAYLTNYLDGPVRSLVMNWSWSLCVEEHFYLLAPLVAAGLMALRTHRARLAALAALFLASLAGRVAVAAAVPDAAPEAFSALVYKQTHFRFDTLAAGVLIAYLHRFQKERIAALLARPALRRAAIALAVGCLLCLLAPWLFGRSAFYYAFAWGALTSAMYAPLLLLALVRPGPALRFLGLPAFRVAATLGYGIYLVHPPLCGRIVRFLALRLDPGAPPLLCWAAALALLLLAAALYAYVLHLVVEKPALALRRRLFP